MKLCLRVSVAIEGHPWLPVGPRLRRGDPMPMEAHYEANAGYHFQATKEGVAEATHCMAQLQIYLNKHHDSAPAKKDTAKKKPDEPGEQKELVDTPTPKTKSSVRGRRNNKV